MSFHISVIDDQIHLGWDGVNPPGLREEVLRPFMYEQFITLTKAPIMTRLKRPDDLLTNYPLLKVRARWWKSTETFVMSLCVDNLRRVFLECRGVYVKSGQADIDRLYQEQEAFRKDLAKTSLIKDLPAAKLPAYPYKAKPLAEYQHRGVAYLTNVKAGIMFADCGCLAGDTVVRYNRGGLGKRITLEALYKKLTSPRGHFNHALPTRVRAFKGDCIGLHEIVKVVQSGVKKVWKLTLADGKQVKGTSDHLILTKEGWVELGQLEFGAEVMVDNLVRHKTKATKVKPKKYNDKRRAVGPHHPFARYQSCHGGTSGSRLLEVHRLLFEANASGLSVEEFIGATYSGMVAGLVFVDPDTHHIHHRDGNHLNNDLANLECIAAQEHRLEHSKGYLGYSHFGHGEPEYSKVMSVDYVGPEMTYDIVCTDPHRNFVANGIVVHNCGKTYMVICSTEQQIKQGKLERGKTLVCVKLATIKHGWIADTAKFSDLKIQPLWTRSTYKRREKLLAMLNTDADFYVINHEGLRVLEDELVAKQFKKVVVDESTILKGYRGMHVQKHGAIGKALNRVSAHADYRVIMSGTPAPNDADDLWGQFAFIDPYGFMLGRSYRDFKGSYMKEIFMGDPKNPDTRSMFVMTVDGRRQVSDIVKPAAFRVIMREHLKDMPEITIFSRSLPMTDEIMRCYDEMEEKLETELDGEIITATIMLAKMQKLSQITGGFMIDKDGNAHSVDKNPKLEMLDDLLHDEIAKEEKVVIYAEYRYEIETIAERYKRYGVVTVYGGNSSAKNDDNIGLFLEDPTKRLIVMHPASAAWGITLTNARYMIFYSTGYSNERDYQSVKRIERASQKRAMFVGYLLCEDSIDEYKYDTIVVKQTGQLQLIDQVSMEKNVESLRQSLKGALARKRASRQKKRSRKSAAA